MTNDPAPPDMPASDTSASQAPALASPAFAEPAYVPRTGWPAVAATFAAVTIFTTAITVASLVTLALLHEKAGADSSTMSNERMLLVSVLIMQAVITAMTLFAAGRYGSRPADVLALRPPRGGWRSVAVSFAGLIAIVTLVNSATKLLSPGDIEHDLQPFIGLAHSDLWWICLLAVGIGAPVSEELLFRGFLFPALAKSPVGPKGAGFLTALGWSALHASYSLPGVIEVGLIGLYLAYLLWRTGSLWVPMLCHGIYNSALFGLIALSPVVPAAGG